MRDIGFYNNTGSFRLTCEEKEHLGHNAIYLLVHQLKTLDLVDGVRHACHRLLRCRSVLARLAPRVLAVFVGDWPAQQASRLQEDDVLADAVEVVLDLAGLDASDGGPVLKLVVLGLVTIFKVRGRHALHGHFGCLKIHKRSDERLSTQSPEGPSLNWQFSARGKRLEVPAQFNVCACDIWKQSAEQLEEAGVPHSQAREQTRLDAGTLARLTDMRKYKESRGKRCGT